MPRSILAEHMRLLDKDHLCAQFLGWQCRIRQISAREYGGQPLAAMRPSAATRKGEVILPDMTVLLVPHAPEESTAFFRFQVQKTADPARVREAGVGYLAGDFYQQPDLFSDELTAVFSAGSATAQKLVKAREVVLGFAQYSQGYRMFCAVRRLPARSAARDSSLWQSRLFNPNVANDADVLAFKPDWKTAQAAAIEG